MMRPQPNSCSKAATFNLATHPHSLAMHEESSSHCAAGSGQGGPRLTRGDFGVAAGGGGVRCKGCHCTPHMAVTIAGCPLMPTALTTHRNSQAMWYTPAVPCLHIHLRPSGWGQCTTCKPTHANQHTLWCISAGTSSGTQSGTVAGLPPNVMRSCHLPASRTPDTAAANTHTCQNNHLMGSQACPQPNSVGRVHITPTPHAAHPRPHSTAPPTGGTQWCNATLDRHA